MKFKNYIEVQSGIKDSADSPGTLDQVLTSTATGVAWVDPSTISAEAATLVVIECKNTSGATITKGTPVYQTGTVGATDVIEIAPADALISTGKQPAIGLLQTTLNNNGFGKVVITGEFLNFTTDPIDGVTPITGQKVFLKSGGGLTLTKPTGAENGIQNLGLIGKVSGGNAGSITVSSIMRTNDVPNLPTGKIWVGDGNTIVSDTVFLDEPNGRMGIGTTSPSGLLHVSSGTSGDAIVIIESDTDNNNENDNPQLQFKQDGGNTIAKAGLTGDQGQIFGNSLGNAAYFGNDENASVQFYTNATAALTIREDGDVGIGTTSPNGTLNIRSVSSTGSEYNLSSLSNSGTQLFYVRNDGVVVVSNNYFYVTSSQGAYFDGSVKARGGITDDGGTLGLGGGGNTNHLNILTSGNVGIGTTSPTNKLDVIGTLSATDIRVGSTASGEGIIRYNGGSGNGIGIVTGALNSSAIGLFVDHSANNRNVGIGTTSPGAKLDVNGEIRSDKTVNGISFSSTGGGASFSAFDVYTATNGGLLRLYDENGQTVNIDGRSASGDTYFNNGGNVGIGTTSPTGKLDVREANVTISTSNSMSDGIRGLKIEGTNAGVEIAGSGNDWWVSALGSGLSIYDTTVDSYRFKILNNGNVGIGTTTPAEKLDVSGVVLANAFRTDVNTSDYSVISRSSAGNAPLYVQSADSGTNQPIAKFFYGNAAPNQGSIVLNVAKDETYFSNTNVGIGTTSPKRKLHVDNSSGVGEAVISGTTGATLYFRPNTSYSLAGNFGIFATGLTSGTYESTMDFKGYYNGVTTPLTIKGSGNVGIGTTNPLKKLSVNGGDIAVNNGNGFIVGAAITGNTEIGRLSASSGQLELITESTRDIKFASTAHGNIMFLEGTNGNVGIGTTGPGGKLHIHQTGSGTNNSIITEDDARKIFIGRDSIKATDLSDNPAELYIQQHGGNATFGSDVSLGGNLTLTTNARYLRAEDSAGTTARLLGINGSNTTYIGPIDAYAGGSIFYGVSANVSAQTFYTGASARMHINSTGNVGIGTTSPGQKLEVIGRTKITQSGDALRINSSDANGPYVTWQNNGSNIGYIGAGYHLWSSPNNIATSLGIRAQTRLDLGIQSSVHMTMLDSGNVGIGTTSPSGLLHVSSGTSGDAIVIIESDTDNNNENDNPQLQFKQDGGNTIAKAGLTGDQGQIFGNSLGNAAYFGNDENASVQFYTNATAALTIREDGDVGIGTTSPNGTLNIRSVSSTGSEYNLSSLSNSGTQLFYVRNDGVVVVSNNYLYVTSSQGAYFDGSVKARGGITDDGGTLGLGGGGNTNHLNILTSGNVGIGTTSPSAKLHIQENSDPTSSVSGLRLSANASGTNKYLPAIEWSYGASGTPSFAKIETIRGSGTGGILTFSTATTSSVMTETMRITSDGNVGIGTASPGAKLDVAATTDAVIRLTSTGNGLGADTALGSLQFYGNDASVPGAGIKSSIVAKTEATLGDDSNLIFSTSDGTTNDVERMRITAGGNIGIGTSSPGAQLHVYSTGNSELEVQRASGALFNVQAQASLATIGTDSNHPLYLKTNAGTRVAITTAGNVGIGTTSPGALLQVGGGASYNTLFHTFDQYNEVKFHGVSNQSASGVWQFINDGTWDQTRFYVQDANNVASRLTFRFTGNNGVNEILAGTSTGNVGIGTTTPGYTLDVNGSLHSTNINIADGIYHEGDTNTYMQFHANDQWRVVTNGTERLEVNNTEVTVANNLVVNGSIYASQYIYHTGDIDTYMRFPSNDTISWNTAGSERMRVNSSGNVGIGTTSPGGKLTISNNGAEGIEFFPNNFTNGNTTQHYDRTASVYSISKTIAAEYRFNIGTSEKMRITSTGTVGIGVTNPSARIHADYSGLAGKFVSSQSTGLEVQGGGNGQPIARFKDTSASEKVTIASTGRVGIGYTSPSTKLSVNGGVQIADEAAAASAALVGTLRYRSTANTSFVDMCMQTGSTTYTWVNIVSNFW